MTCVSCYCLSQLFPPCSRPAPFRSPPPTPGPDDPPSVPTHYPVSVAPSHSSIPWSYPPLNKMLFLSSSLESSCPETPGVSREECDPLLPTRIPLLSPPAPRAEVQIYYCQGPDSLFPTSESKRH